MSKEPKYWQCGITEEVIDLVDLNVRDALKHYVTEIGSLQVSWWKRTKEPEIIFYTGLEDEFKKKVTLFELLCNECELYKDADTHDKKAKLFRMLFQTYVRWRIAYLGIDANGHKVKP